MYRISVILFLLLSAQCVFCQKKQICESIDSLITQKTNKPFNGVILVSENGKIIYKKVTGYSDLNKKTRLKYDNKFVVGSISKQITAVLVLQEYDKGRLKLSDVLSLYLPELQQPWSSEVTIHQLLTHTHGVRELDMPLAFSAGSQYEYSQIGYDLLAKILEKITNESFADLSTKLFNKCGMKNTFHPATYSETNDVKGYIKNEDGSIVLDNGATKYVAAGGFISTANDLLIWNKYLHHEKLLKTDTYKMMINPQDGAVRNHPIFGETKYGYGITVDNTDNLLQLGQTGYVPGFVSMDFYFPKMATSVIVLENIVYDGDNLKKTFYYHSNILNIVKQSLKVN